MCGAAPSCAAISAAESPAAAMLAALDADEFGTTVSDAARVAEAIEPWMDGEARVGAAGTATIETSPRSTVCPLFK